MRYRVFFFVILFAGACGPACAQYAHPDLKAGKRNISSFVLMPLQVELSKISMKGGEPMMEESSQAEEALAPVFARVLERDGYAVDQKSLVPATLAQDPRLQYTVNDIQNKFNEILKQVVHKSGDVRKGRFTLGDTVINLPQGERADALLFVHVEGQILTGNKKAFDFFFGTGGMSDTFRVFVGMVDPRNGNLLYFSKLNLEGNIIADTTDLEAAMQRHLALFLEVSPPHKAIKDLGPGRVP